METVTMDFSFPMTSREYGRFLVSAHDHLPGIRIRHVEAEYCYVPGKAIVSVSVPKDIAMLLKLEFGGNIVKRPNMEMEKISNMKLEIFKARNIKNKYSLELEFKNFNKNLNEGLIIKNTDTWE